MGSITQVETHPVITAIRPLKSVQIKVEHDEIPSSPSPSSLSETIPLPPPSTNPTEILSVDEKTPDSHVARDPRLIRLTGAHPFNCEPPLTDLYREGISSISFYWKDTKF